MRLFTLLLPAFLLSSCAGGWHDSDKQDYLHQCRTEAAGMYLETSQVDKYCQCNLEAVMKHYPTMEEVVFNKDSTAVRQELLDCSVKARR